MGTPYPDVIRLLMSARSDGTYSRLGGAVRSPLERYGLLWRALEQLLLARPGESVDAALTVALASSHVPAMETQLADLAEALKPLAALSDTRLRDLLDPRRDRLTDVQYFRTQLRSVAKINPRGSLSQREVSAIARALRELRNAVVHAGAVTTDRDLTPAFTAACGLLDALLVRLYAGTFDLRAGDVETLMSETSS